MPRLPIGQLPNYLLLALLSPFLVILIVVLLVVWNLLCLFPSFMRFLEEIPDNSLTEAYHHHNQ